VTERERSERPAFASRATAGKPERPAFASPATADKPERPERSERSERSERPERPERLSAWLSALEARHLSNLRIPEVTRALRALSSTYVERRQALRRGAALESAGKRAAFALFYGPLHYLITSHVIRALGPAAVPESILDIGCGTGVGGAAWAMSAPGVVSRVTGIDRHPWSVEESQWTYARLGVPGSARTGTLDRLPRVRPGSGIVAAYVLNELSDSERARVIAWLLDAAGRGAQVLVIEPLARKLVPWWDGFAAQATSAGGRADEWRFRVDLPPLVTLLDRAAGLDHRELTARSVWM
jgi:hypothetical protein